MLADVGRRRRGTAALDLEDEDASRRRDGTDRTDGTDGTDEIDGMDREQSRGVSPEPRSLLCGWLWTAFRAGSGAAWVGWLGGVGSSDGGQGSTLDSGFASRCGWTIR